MKTLIAFTGHMMTTKKKKTLFFRIIMLFNGEEQRNAAPPPRNEKKKPSRSRGDSQTEERKTEEKKGLEKRCWRGHKTKSKYVGIPNSGHCSSTLAIQCMLMKVLCALCWPKFTTSTTLLHGMESRRRVFHHIHSVKMHKVYFQLLYVKKMKRQLWSAGISLLPGRAVGLQRGHHGSSEDRGRVLIFITADDVTLTCGDSSVLRT